MSERNRERPPEQLFTSKYGIRCDHGVGIELLNIPMGVVEKIGGKDVITKDIHPNVFGGSWPLGAGQSGDYFTVEFPDNTPAEKIQEFINTIEELYGGSK